MNPGDIIRVEDNDHLDLCQNCFGRIVKIVGFFVIFEVIAIETPRAWELFFEDCHRIVSNNEIRGTTIENARPTC